MDAHFQMIIHSLLIAIVVYFLMVQFMGVPEFVAQTRATLVFAASVAYMTLWGHGLPSWPVSV